MDLSQEDMIEKINRVLAKVQEHFDNVDTQSVPEQYRNDARNWWLREYRKKTGNQNINNFSFSADDILNQNIPSWVVGCSGRADLFAKYASEIGLNVNIVAMVDTASKKEYPDGHQIIVVNSPDGSQQMIDPGRGCVIYQKAKIPGDCKVGNKVIYNRKDGRTEYRIAAVLTPEEHAQIDSIEKLAQVYKSDKQSVKDGFYYAIRKIKEKGRQALFKFYKTDINQND